MCCIDVGDRFRLIDGGGEEHIGEFRERKDHKFGDGIKDITVIRYLRDDGEMHGVIANGARLIERVS